MNTTERQKSRLRRCTCYGIKRLAKHRKIIVYGYNTFFMELCRNRHLESCVSRIIDNNNHIWGQKVIVCGKKFEIENPENIKECRSGEALVVIIAPYFQQLYHQLLEINPRLSIYYYRTKEDRTALRYNFLFKKRELKDIILFRSGKNNLPLFDGDDNARVLFDYMVERGYQNKYRLVWVVKETRDFSQLKSENVDIVSYEWEWAKNPFKAIKYAYYLHYAKYCFFTDDCYWMRNHSPDQILVLLWHGCGFKARSQKSEPTGPHYDYMTVNSKFYADLHQRMYGCRERQMMITGLPKQDLLFWGCRIPFFEKYGLNRDSKIVFWLPTFRGNVHDNLTSHTFQSQTGLALFDNPEDIQKLSSWLADRNMYLFVKPHPSQKLDEMKISSSDNFIVIEQKELKEKGIHINSLLAKAHGLISDYSSAAVDYMLLDRPIGFVISDLDEYRTARGFAFEPVEAYLPGKEIHTKRDFFEFLYDIKEGNDVCAERRHRLMPLMHQYTDGNSCKRILNCLGLNNRR